MNENEINALISLLDDDDQEIATHVEARIRELGTPLIPLLENQWEGSFSPIFQQKVEGLIHDLQYESVQERILNWQNGGAMDLLEGLWIVATYQYPDLSLHKLQKEIDQLYFDIWPDISPDMHPIDQVKAMNHAFFGRLRFTPNSKQFHAPANSMINVVLESRRGNPISLCLIYMMIAQRIGMPVYGVNLPNLFVLTYKDTGVQFYINVFNRGLVFSTKDIDHYVGQLNLRRLDLFYQPCSNMDIIRRMLRNLMMAFEKIGDTVRQGEIERILASVKGPNDSLPLSDYTQR